MSGPENNLNSKQLVVNSNNTCSCASVFSQTLATFIVLGKDAFQSIFIDLSALTLGHWSGSIPGVEGIFWTPGTLNENAPQLTGRDAQIGKGLTSDHIGSHPYLFAEIDDCDFAEQVARIEKAIKAGLPAPTMAISSGNKSIHWYWLLNQAYLPTESSENSKVQIHFGRWSEYQARLAAIIGGDHRLIDAVRKMRLPVGKLPSGRNQALIYHDDRVVYRNEMEQAIDRLFCDLSEEEQNPHIERINLRNTGKTSVHVNVDHDGSDWEQTLGGRKKCSVRCPSPDHIDKTPSAFISRNLHGKVFCHCSTCGVTFWPKREEKEYIFPRIKKENPQQETFSIQRYLDSELVQGRYLPYYPVKENIRILAFDSTMGTGKTEAISTVLKNIPYDHTVLALVHRRSLADSLSKRLELQCYLDLPNGQNENIDQDVVITPDSIWRLNEEAYFQKPLVVVIDEITQVLQHISNGPAHHSVKQKAFDLIRKLLSHASFIIVADALLTPRSIEWIQDIAKVEDKNVEIRGTKTRTWPHNYNVSFDARSWNASLLEDIGNGKTIGLPTQSLKHAGTIRKLIEQFFPETKILTITPETRETAEVINAFISGQMKNYQVVIYTPTLSTGISITPDIFEPDVIYAWVCSGSGTAQDALQQIHRIRSIKSNNIFIHVDGRGKTNLETDGDNIFRSGVALRQEIARDLNYTIPTTREEQVLEADYSYLHSHTLGEIRSNGGDGASIKQSFLALLRREIPEAQLNIDDEKTTKKKKQESAKKKKKTLRDAENAAQATFRHGEVLRVIEAQDLSKLEADDPSSDKYARMKYRCRELTGGELTEITIHQLLFENLGHQVERASSLLCHVLNIQSPKAPLMQDLRQLQDQVPSGHFIFHREASKLIAEHLKAFGVNPALLFAEKYNPTLLKPDESAKNLQELYEQPNYPDRMGRALNSKPDRQYIQKPNRTLTNILKRLGMQTNSSRPGADENGKRERTYRLDNISREQIRGYVLRNLDLKISEVQTQLDILLRGDETVGFGPSRDEVVNPSTSEVVSNGNKGMNTYEGVDDAWLDELAAPGESRLETMERVYSEIVRDAEVASAGMG